MKKHIIFLLIYMFVMGLGLFVTKHMLNTPYDSDAFSHTFLPFMMFLALMVLIYGMRFRYTLKLAPPKRISYFFILPFVPVVLLVVMSATANFSLSLAFVLPMLDVLFIGIAEEGLYRGIILGGLAKRIKPIYAILLSSVLFAALHLLNVLGGLSWTDVFNQLLSTFIMGVFLGAIYIYTRNILYPFFFHLLWDYIFLSNGLTIGPYAPTLFIITVVLEILVTVVILWKIKKVRTIATYDSTLL
ncbi:CPBP family intramembrane metalloprotease [Staphylococcus chromogenes]|uniref:CPBP family intramembrane glutamic endopeptidase n=1 Tax=Staphylococcus chromogenes TaxID=46126 RepID=UPI0021CF873C|nr:CPBP family intramembrane glutamic endopeptidase [Staphylococcus chromogenes]UXS67941.1 CPBP family intramembrane metalloprotease [Staphylococcus chromogenes]